MIVKWDSEKRNNASLSNGGLSAYIGSKKGYVIANEYKTYGKYYLEIVCKRVTGYSKIGVINSHGSIWEIESSRSFPISNNDVISLLIDVDDRKVNFWRNGWVIERFFSNVSGPLSPVVRCMSDGSTPSMEITANFGATPFKYKLPLGFLPYQTQEKVLVLSNGVCLKYSNIGWEGVTNSSPTEQDYINHGMDDISIIPESAWKELSGDVQVCYWTNDLYKPEASFNIETEPFTLAEEFDDQTIKIIEYTDNPDQEDSTITLETEPFTFYDEVGDSFDVLYYTDDPDKTEAELEINHNYSPLDEFDGDFELVTWTMEEEAEVQEELKPIFKEKIEDGNLYGVTVDLSKGTINIK
ncbi:hypothetical protein WJ0W_003498 [Paenibacillus melissococcoides]|uniref:B30.2/SPRY domain-containing protein n=1 Tax=Paenibacillus melissococcoides TaxID=2912268 RepID=A0ABN8U597_9BACL|nr:MULTISPECIES: hypothetical protein [Paenibacillus]MEB9895639.1 hypothetical protein [Bacillus cereus]CAH8246263.1 hypothetical protein WJ0W_003498 [Paenibacillus melissococcoides]CAH8713446.1 hypothetical protein WDD9_003571 [Paenibacillus melissococcoides]CAH8714180.1 hypothetical protein HTL2_003874 [Paenibacillus melissococcoides]GIO80914.1 hypothetical protein J6TS7_45240 [Paenibacillus dendritiformis]